MTTIVVHKTNDMEGVAKILNHPRVYNMAADDLSPKPYIPDVSGFYIMNEGKTGVVRLDRAGAICCNAHIAALPELWGKGVEFAKEAISWGFKNTTYTKVVALVPEYNGLTLSLCDNCGFKREGLVTKSFLKNWKCHDQVLFGITKTEFFKGE
tara:strand:- start:29 stop:487 length:459 start_codon:yes stop_codon:yes gene_type:complete